jgi:hypothetical protein
MPADIPSLYSLPSAPVTVWLNFAGNPAWVWDSGWIPTTPAYAGSADYLANIWQLVAETLSPFNVDVTTVQPATLDHFKSLEVLIGGNGAWTGTTDGGLTYNVGQFSQPGESNCVFVFSDNFGYNDIAIAQTVAHEVGHAFGLQHQSLWNGTTLVDEYNPGTAASAPIMGTSEFAQRGLWWNGLNDQDVPQDDLAVITSATNGFGYRPQDYGQTPETAYPLTSTASGVIATAGDTDTFRILDAGGPLTVTVAVAPFGAMLHAKLLIEDPAGNVLATAADPDTLGQTATADLPAGTYYAVVESYGGYGDLGQYTISIPEPSIAGIVLLGLRRRRRICRH